jgi:hypothetical protein
MWTIKPEPVSAAQKRSEAVEGSSFSAGESFCPAGVGDVPCDFRGEEFFPSEFSDPVFRMMHAAGVLQ